MRPSLRLEDVAALAENFGETYEKIGVLRKLTEEFTAYIERNAASVRNYGQLWREGRYISTAFIESLVNSLLGKRFTKKQQMQWSERGAHLLLQVRTQVANDELRETFGCWYPSMRVVEREPDALQAA